MPLVVPVVAGECATVNLTNLLTTPVGVSISKVKRGAGSGGVNVGFSSDQNNAPGTTRRYVYYVPTDRIRTAPIADLGGSGTLKAGLYGALVVAPASAATGRRTEFIDPVTVVAADIGHPYCPLPSARKHAGGVPG